MAGICFAGAIYGVLKFSGNFERGLRFEESVGIEDGVVRVSRLNEGKHALEWHDGRVGFEVSGGVVHLDLVGISSEMAENMWVSTPTESDFVTLSTLMDGVQGNQLECVGVRINFGGKARLKNGDEYIDAGDEKDSFDMNPRASGGFTYEIGVFEKQPSLMLSWMAALIDMLNDQVKVIEEGDERSDYD